MSNLAQRLLEISLFFVQRVDCKYLRETESFGVLADHSITHNVEIGIASGKYKATQFKYCIAKAKMGQEIRVRRDIVSLEEVLADLKTEQNETPVNTRLPDYVYLDLQRITRQAYRTRKTQEEYFTEVFEDCVVSRY